MPWTSLNIQVILEDNEMCDVILFFKYMNKTTKKKEVIKIIRKFLSIISAICN